MRRLVIVGLGAALLAAPLGARGAEPDPDRAALIIEEIREHRAKTERGARRSSHRNAPPRHGGRPQAAGPLGAPREAANPPPPADAPDTAAYLEESLGEGLGAGDPKLLDMVFEGLRATGKGERELAASLERAALDAALSYPNMNERVKIDAWTLAARASLGDASSVETLEKWAREGGRAAADRHDRRALTRSRVVPMRCAEALPCLAYLKVEGVRELAEEILRGDPAPKAGDARVRTMSSIYGASRLKGAVQVLLDLDREAGTGLVLSLVEDGAIPLGHRTQLFAAGAEFLTGDNAAGDTLAAAFTRLIDAMILKGFDERRPDPGMMTLMNVTYRWLPKRETVLKDLEKLEAALPQRTKRYVTSRVSLYRRQMGLTDKTTPGPRAPWRPEAGVPRPATGPRPPAGNQGGGENEF